MEDATILVELEKLDSCKSVGISVSPESRIVTDKKGFVIYGIAIVFLLFSLMFISIRSESRHNIGYSDDCGNICGVNNTYIPGLNCSGKDYSDKPYFSYGCVAECGEKGAYPDGRCIPDHRVPYTIRKIGDYGLIVLYETLEDIGQNWWKFFFAITLSIVLSILTMVTLRYKPAPLVWTLIILGIMFLCAVSATFWYFAVATGFGEVFCLTMAIVSTIIAFIVLIVFLVSLKKIRLIVQLYHETVKVLAAMPQLIIIPILTIFVQFIILAICITSTFYLLYYTELRKIQTPSDVAKYEHKFTRSPFTWFTICLNIIVTAWTLRFIKGIQCMIISGSVAKWYFAEKKNCLDSPVLTSTKITLRYHLGTVAFGSFLMTLFAIVKAVLKAIFRCCRCLIVLYCPRVEYVLRFISNDAFIQTALHGQSFFKSAKRATTLLLSNAKSLIAINCVGEFVLAMIIIGVTTIATAVSFPFFLTWEFSPAFLTLVCFIFNLFIVCITFGTFQAIIDTLFICFCEDKVLNDGVSRPYFMPKGIMKFAVKSQKMYERLRD